MLYYNYRKPHARWDSSLGYSPSFCLNWESHFPSLLHFRSWWMFCCAYIALRFLIRQFVLLKPTVWGPTRAALATSLAKASSYVAFDTVGQGIHIRVTLLGFARSFITSREFHISLDVVVQFPIACNIILFSNKCVSACFLQPRVLSWRFAKFPLVRLGKS